MTDTGNRARKTSGTQGFWYYIARVLYYESVLLLILVHMMSMFLSLPLEIFLHIFSYVAFRERFRLRIVCQSWNRLLIHPVLLQHLDFNRFGGGRKLMRGLRACFNHATQVFSLDLSTILASCVYLRTISDGRLTHLKRLSVASSRIDTEIMTILLQRTRCLQELDMSYNSEIRDDVCEVITKFASHTLEVLYLPTHLSFWYPSRSLPMLDSCQELVTLGVDGDMIDPKFIVDIFNGLKLKKLRKLRFTDVKAIYAIKVLRAINSNHSMRIELCICRCPYLWESPTEVTARLSSLSIPLCTQCKFDITTFRWK